MNKKQSCPSRGSGARGSWADAILFQLTWIVVRFESKPSNALWGCYGDPTTLNYFSYCPVYKARLGSALRRLRGCLRRPGATRTSLDANQFILRDLLSRLMAGESDSAIPSELSLSPPALWLLGAGLVVSSSFLFFPFALPHFLRVRASLPLNLILPS